MIPRGLDATAANLILVSDKVRQVVAGQIPLPEVVELFLTNYCNFACPFCRCAKYHGDTRQFMDFDTLARLLEELVGQGVRRIELGGGGEPLEHPMIRQVLERFREQGFRFGLITNGWRLTEFPELVDSIIECADWVRFSLDGLTDDVYRVVHGRPNIAYQPLRAAIAELVRRARARDGVGWAPKVGIKLILQRPNRHQLLAAVDEALDLGVNYLQFKWLENHPWSIPPEERPGLSEALHARLQQLRDGSLIVDVLPGYEAREVRERCIMSVLHPLIDWDGTIYFCAFFHHRKETHSIGNITTQRFFDCWNSEYHRDRRRLVDPAQCVANCPMLRYNPIMKFIVEEGFRFHYI